MKNYKITVNGVSYNVTVEEAGEVAAQGVPAAAAPQPSAPAPSSPAVQGNVTVEAPMPGNILKVNAAVGQKVKSGEALVILEAMKMENEIVSPRDGVIASVNVKKGDSVEAGQVLITLN